MRLELLERALLERVLLRGPRGPRVAQRRLLLLEAHDLRLVLGLARPPELLVEQLLLVQGALTFGLQVGLQVGPGRLVLARGVPRTRQLRAQLAPRALFEGKDALEVLRRQRIVGQLYPAAQSVMDAEASRAFEDAAESVIDPVGGAGR